MRSRGLQERLAAGTAKLEFEPEHGYLRSLLSALDVPESSQVLVFSKTSLQRERISPKTPRAIYFNDDVMIGFCRGGKVIEISAADEVDRHGVLHARPGARREAGPAAADRVLPALPQLIGQPGIPRASRPFAFRGPARQSASCERVVPHRSHKPARRALGRLVRDRHERPAEAHGQHDRPGAEDGPRT